MAVINVNSAELRMQADKLRQYRKQHILAMNRLRQLMLTLDEVWKGEAQEAFVAKYMSMKRSFDEFESLLDQYARLMRRVADEMEETDREMKRKIQRIG